MRIAVLALVLAAGSPALAQSPPQAASPAQAAPGTPGAQSDGKTQDKVKDDYTLPAQPRGRFSFAPVDEGFLRFDHKAGEVALCKPGSAGWSCAPVDDKTAAARQVAQDEEAKALEKLGSEISALKDALAGLKDDVSDLKSLQGAVAGVKDEVAGLKGLKDDISALQKDVAALRPPPPPPPPHPVPPDTVPPSDETGSIALKRDIARARGFIAETWSRLVDMIENLRKDMIRKDGDRDLSRT